jgi:hypothetical protein
VLPGDTVLYTFRLEILYPQKVHLAGGAAKEGHEVNLITYPRLSCVDAARFVTIHRS